GRPALALGAASRSRQNTLTGTEFDNQLFFERLVLGQPRIDVGTRGQARHAALRGIAADDFQEIGDRLMVALQVELDQGQSAAALFLSAFAFLARAWWPVLDGHRVTGFE